MASTWYPTPTPGRNLDQVPTEVEKRWYQHSCPNLGDDFRLVYRPSQTYNCHAWSLGFTDRSVFAGPHEVIESTFRAYMYERCGVNEAEIDVYHKPDAPPTMTVQVNGHPMQVANRAYQATIHSHRNEDRNVQLGSTSKMGQAHVIRFSRMNLSDTRAWNVSRYGRIFNHYRRSAEHPTRRGQEDNATKIPLQMTASGGEMWPNPVTYPQNHPLEKAAPEQPMGNNGGNQTSRQRMVWKLRHYQPFQKIPKPSKSAVKYIQGIEERVRSNPKAKEVVKQFDKLYKKWKETWSDPRFAFDNNAGARPDVPEFLQLVALRSIIVPLVISKLCGKDDFMAVHLYDAVETDKTYKVSDRDGPNYLVLQRRANLIVEMNNKRWPK